MRRSPHTSPWLPSRFNSRTPGGVRLEKLRAESFSKSFNSRTPGGVRHRFNPFRLLAYQFQFTHPGRGATKLSDDRVKRKKLFQFTHPGRGATVQVELEERVSPVSIHAPREGCDFAVRLCLPISAMFQFTHPGRGATHHPRCAGTPMTRFNSRTPGGVRREARALLLPFLKFQFTHPGRGATSQLGNHTIVTAVSIHAPREGCDARVLSSEVSNAEFQFTHPGRGATVVHTIGATSNKFQFTHPGRGATQTPTIGVLRLGVSIHAPREGCDSVVQSCVLWGG